MNINKHYLALEESYLFSAINKKVAAYQAAHPEAAIIRLGIGDVTLPLCPAVISALHEAVDDMSRTATFKGYGPEQGYDFLKEAVSEYYQREHQVALDNNEIFISDGAKSDLGNILDLFAVENTVLIPDPVYPVYVDTNIMAGRQILFADANAANGFLPLPDEKQAVDVIYLCSPNNPTGAVYNRQQLKQWVDYARRQQAIILFDAAYEIFVGDAELPRSIYEIDGAKECAIEFCSFSKTAGFTGTRCGYTIVPLALERGGASLNHMWLRRQTTKFNGVPYIVQKAAAAVLTPQGQKECRENVRYYQTNAQIIADALDEVGIWYTGGKNSPYIWLKCPNGRSSWAFFDDLLEKVHIVGTPGAGFGKNGEGFFRLTAFGDQEKTREAAERLKKLFA